MERFIDRTQLLQLFGPVPTSRSARFDKARGICRFYGIREVQSGNRIVYVKADALNASKNIKPLDA